MIFFKNIFQKLFLSEKRKVEVGDQVSYKTILGKEIGIVKDVQGATARVIVEDSYSTLSQWINTNKLTIIT